MIICSNRNGLLLRKTMFGLGLQSVSTLARMVILLDVLTPASLHPFLKHHHWNMERGRFISKLESFHWPFLCCCYSVLQEQRCWISAASVIGRKPRVWCGWGLPTNGAQSFTLWDIWKLWWLLGVEASAGSIGQSFKYAGDLILWQRSCLIESGLHALFSSASCLLHILFSFFLFLLLTNFVSENSIQLF